MEVQGRKATAAEETAKAVDGSLLRRLEALWEARDQFKSRNPALSAPREWLTFQEHLRRAERWRLAGQLDGMTPHLTEAESAQKDLTSALSKSAESGLPPFLGAGLSRRVGPPSASADPPLPEKQLEATLKSLAQRVSRTMPALAQ